MSAGQRASSENKLEKKLFHVRKELHREAKAARTKETMRVVKKVKAFREKVERSKDVPAEVKALREKELHKYESELEHIKTVNLDTIRDHRLHMALSSVSDTEARSAIMDLCLPPPPLPTEGPLARVTRRVLDCQTLKRAADAAVQRLIDVIVAEKEAAAEDNDGDDGGRPGKKRKRGTSDAGKRDKNKKGKNVHGVSKARGEDLMDDSEDEEEFAHEDDHISGDDDGGDDDGGDDVDSDIAVKPSKHHPKKDIVISKKDPAGKKNKKETVSKPLKMESQFMDTLGGGLSDISMSDDDEVAQPAKRKNRMGQQARRQLWEKRFGKNAKHLALEEAASGSGKSGGKGQFNGKGGKDKPGRPSKGKQAEGGTTEKKEEKLHPSWEAKKKMQKNTIAPFAGKKITFS